MYPGCTEGVRSVYRVYTGVPRGVHTQVYASGCTLGCAIPGLYLRVYPRVYLRCVRVGVHLRVYLRVVYSRFTVGQEDRPLPFPFHCWARKEASLPIPVSLLVEERRPPSLIPVSLLVNSSHPCAKVLSVSGSLLFLSRFTVGLSPTFPFHCWSRLLASSSPVSLWSKAAVPGRLIPHNVYIPDIPARTNDAEQLFTECEKPPFWPG